MLTKFENLVGSRYYSIKGKPTILRATRNADGIAKVRATACGLMRDKFGLNSTYNVLAEAKLAHWKRGDVNTVNTI